jgi:hypothetical protein
MYLTLKVGDKIKFIGSSNGRVSFGTIYQITRINIAPHVTAKPQYYIICDDGSERFTFAEASKYELVTDEIVGNKNVNNDVDFLELLKGY